MIGPTNAMTVTGTVDPSGVTVGSDTKPVKIVNGVATMVTNDLVDTATAQKITGQKKFTSSSAHAFTNIFNSTYEDVSGSYPPDTRYTGLAIQDRNNHTLAQLDSEFDSSGNSVLGLRCFKTGQSEIDIYLTNTANNTRYARLINQRSYSASNTSDIVTIGSLQASTDVVHTAGEETIAGNKTIKGLIITGMEGVWFSLSYVTNHYSKICGIPSTATNFNFEIEIMGYDGKMTLHITKEGSAIRGFATWTDTQELTPIAPFVILNTTTGEYEVWGYRTVGRFYFYPKKLLFTNTSQNVDTMTKYGTNTNTDPYGTSDYQTEGVNNPKINIPVRILTGEIVNS